MSCLHRFLFLSLLILVPLSQVDSTVITQAQLNTCTRNPLPGEIKCKQKLVVLLSVENDNSDVPDEITAYPPTSDASMDSDSVICVNNNGPQDCPCPSDCAVDPTCTCRQLTTPFTVLVGKGHSYWEYPTFYEQSVVDSLTEVFTQHSQGNLCPGTVPRCLSIVRTLRNEPGYGNSAVTGQPVPDADGFCCTCSYSNQLIGSIIDIFTDRGVPSIPRSQVKCSVFASGLFPASSHCLNVSDTVWRIFRLGDPQLNYHINVSVDLSSDASGNPTTTPQRYWLDLSPNNIVQTFPDSGTPIIKAMIVGDIGVGSALQPQSFDDSFLAIPVLRGKYLPNPNQSNNLTSGYLYEQKDRWLMIPRELFANGQECGMIGTTFTAFKYQPYGCDRPAGTCSDGQIRDRLDPNNWEKYSSSSVNWNVKDNYIGAWKDNVSAWGFQVQSVDASQPAYADVYGEPVPPTVTGAFMIPWEQPISTLLRVEILADNINVTEYVGAGRIVAAAFYNKNNNASSTIEAHKEEGEIHVIAENSQDYPAIFYASVANCSENVMYGFQQRSQIDASSTYLFVFDISVNDDNAANRSCTVVLKNSDGTELDQRDVGFNTTALQLSDVEFYQVDSSNAKNGTVNRNHWRLSDIAQCKKCGLKLACQLANTCGIFGGLMVAVEALAGIGLLILLIKMSPCILRTLCAAGGALGSMGPRGGGRRRSRSRTRSRSRSRSRSKRDRDRKSRRRDKRDRRSHYAYSSDSDASSDSERESSRRRSKRDSYRTPSKNTPSKAPRDRGTPEHYHGHGSPAPGPGGFVFVAPPSPQMYSPHHTFPMPSPSPGPPPMMYSHPISQPIMMGPYGAPPVQGGEPGMSQQQGGSGVGPNFYANPVFQTFPPGPRGH